MALLQAPALAQERSGQPAKAGYESGEQAAVSTPPITDIGLTPRKRKHAESARAAAQAAGDPASPPSKLRRLKLISEQPSPQRLKPAATEAAQQPSSIDAVPTELYVHAARGAYAAAPALLQRAPAPSLLDPASRPLDVTLQVRDVAFWRAAKRSLCWALLDTAYAHICGPARWSRHYLRPRRCSDEHQMQRRTSTLA